ncbi:MAG: FHIPEP family type III secretion protein, partial [Opitutales bacterium]
DRITGARKNFSKEMGMLLPTIAVRDNIELEANEYRFLLRGKEVARSKVMPDRFLAMNVVGGDKKLEGIQMVEPVFGLPATWILDEDRRDAEIAGFTVVDPASVLVTHLSDCLREVAHLILEREGTQKLIDLVKDKNPTLVSELLPDLVNVGIIQRVLQNLLREKVPIKNLTLILETIADVSPITKSPDDLSEQARRRLGMYFVKEYESEPGQLTALTLEPSLEQVLISRVRKSQFDVGLIMDPELTEGILNAIEPSLKDMSDKGLAQVLVMSSELRLAFRRFMEPSYPKLAVLAFGELPNETQVNNFGAITLPSNSLPEDLLEVPPEPTPTLTAEATIPVAA